MANINRRRSCYFIYSINPWTFANLCDTVVYCKGGAEMARMTVEEVYRGEKYGVMSAATADYLNNGRPAEYDERTWLDMLLPM